MDDAFYLLKSEELFKSAEIAIHPALHNFATMTTKSSSCSSPHLPHVTLMESIATKSASQDGRIGVKLATQVPLPSFLSSIASSSTTVNAIFV